MIRPESISTPVVKWQVRGVLQAWAVVRGLGLAD